MRLKTAFGCRLLTGTLFGLLSLAACGQGVSDPPPLVLRRAATAPVIDGVPDEACWRDARWQLLRRLDGGVAAVGGTVAFACDASNLYVAVRCDDPEPTRMRAPKTEPNAPELWGGEMLEWFINTAPDGASYVQLGWNPASSLFSARCVATGGGTPQSDVSWAPRWRAVATTGPRGWSAEAAMPFAALGVAPPATGTKWSTNLCRTRRVGDLEFTAISPTGGGFHQPERFADVWFGARAPETAAAVVVAPTNAPLRALVGCWGSMLGYDMLIGARPQLERALGREQVDVRVCNVLDGNSSSMQGWPRRFAELAPYALVVLADIPAAAFSDSQLTDLRNYVEAGGHVVLAGTMAGSRHNPERSWGTSLFGPLLPSQPLLEGRARRTVALTAAEHPLFAGLPATPAFTIWGYRAVVTNGAVVIAVAVPNAGEKGDPLPFVVERVSGRGSVLAFNADYCAGSTGVPVEGLLRGNDFCLSPHHARFWDNLVGYLTGRAAPHPSPPVAEAAPSRIWFDIIRDNNGRIFRPGAPLRVAAPLAGAADLAFPCELTASIEPETGDPAIAAGSYRLASANAEVTVTLPGLDRGAYRLRLARRADGNVVDSFAERFTVALPTLASDAFPFSVWVAPMASEYDEARIAHDLRAIGFDGVSYGGGVAVDGSYTGLLRPYAEARYLSSMQAAGLSTRPCWYPALHYIMQPKTKNYDYTNRQPPTPDAAFPGDSFLPYQFHWMEAYATRYWGRLPLTDGATVGDEVVAIRIPFSDRVRQAYTAATGRPVPDEQSPDAYNLLQYRLMIGGDIMWLTRAAWEAHSPGSAFDCVLTPNSFAGHASPLLNLYATFSSLGVPSPDEYPYGEPKLYQKTLKSAAIAWSGTEFGRLAKPAFTGGQLSNAYYEEFPEQVFAALAAGMREFHVFHFSCASFELNGRQDARFAAIARRTTAEGGRIGRTLNHYERNRARVALLYPHTAHMHLAMGRAFNDDYLKMTGTSKQYLGLTYGMDVAFDWLRRACSHVDILFDEQVRRGDLRDYDVAVLAYSRQTEARTLRELRRFAEAGGTLLVTSDSGRLDEYNAVSDTLAAVLPATVGEERDVPTDYRETRLTQREAWSRGHALAPRAGAEQVFAFADGAAGCVRGPLGRGEAILLGEPLAALKANAAHGEVIAALLNQKARLISRPADGEFSAITFTAPRDGGRIFMVANHNKQSARTTVTARGDESESASTLADLVTGEQIPFVAANGVLSFDIACTSRWGRALALLERPPSTIEVTLSAPTVRAGDDVMLQVRLLARDGLSARATLPFDLEVRDPSGAVRDDLSGVRVADNGVFAFRWRLPVHVARGRWTVTVRSPIGDCSDAAEWQVE